MKKTILFLVSILALAGAATVLFPTRAIADDTEDAATRWSSEALELAATLPVQHEGRIKPLDTYASFLLLRLNGKRSLTDPAGNRLTPLEWVLDCLFHPERARGYECFIIADDQVLEAIGVSHEDKRKRDRYSYAQIEPGRTKLFAQAGHIHKIEPKERTPLEAQIYDLATNFGELDSLLHFFDFARTSFPVDSARSLELAFGDDGVTQASLSDVLDKSAVLWEMRRTLLEDPALDPEQRRSEVSSFDRFDRSIWEVGAIASALAILPPPADVEDPLQWMTPADLVNYTYFKAKPAEKQLSLLRCLEGVSAASDDPTAFREQLKGLHDELASLATTRGEYDMIPLEVAFYRGKYFYYALVLYVLSFLLVAVSWMKPGLAERKLFRWSIPTVQGVATVLLVTGITMRCIIRGRPPVSTLYETILFVTGCSVIVSMAMEWMTRQHVAQAMASGFGVVGLFLANKFETHQATDTMPQLLAVLDTNFWLATHVTTVTLGYAAGLLAGFIAHVWVLGKVFGYRKGDRAFYTGVARMVYGTLCFGLIFSVVGTILGGIWANDSWGRFWGWDPKENGALMIVLWELAVLHARMGGYIKQPGLCLSAIFGGIIVAFSWWGVNMLDVGLHSYGKIAGIYRALASFYVIEGVVILAGIGWLLHQKEQRKAKSAMKLATVSGEQ